jgi:hypothetical protein
MLAEFVVIVALILYQRRARDVRARRDLVAAQPPPGARQAPRARR